MKDRSRRKATNEDPLDAEERQRLLIESATDYAIFTLSPQGLVNSWNTGAERVFGYTEDEIIGQPADILFTPEDRANGVPQKEMITAMEKGRAEDERYHIRKDGSRFYASGVMTPLLEGGLHGFAKIARDLTERKQAEEDLREARENLESMVIERTFELAQLNEDLRLEIAERRRAEMDRVSLLHKIVTSQEDERRRIARDLHDHLGQRLTALRLKLSSLRDCCGEDANISAQIEVLQDIAAGLDADISFLAWQMRPSTIDDLGLSVSVRKYVSEWSQHSEIPAQFHSAGIKEDEQLDPEAEIHLYRILQEALNNVFKHAKATEASVLLERRENLVVLIIEDDGQGFDPSKKTTAEGSKHGLGLIGMQERATLIGGTLEIESTPGRGTTVFVNIPLFLQGENKQ
jgi:PAS domain S-box-containing protein